MDIEEVVTMESLERSAARRRTLSNSSTNSSTLSSASSKTGKHASERGPRRKSSTIKEKSETQLRSSSLSSPGKGMLEDGVEDCDETTPFTANPAPEPQRRETMEPPLRRSSPTSSPLLLKKLPFSPYTGDVVDLVERDVQPAASSLPVAITLAEAGPLNLCVSEAKCLETKMTGFSAANAATNNQNFTPVFGISDDSLENPQPSTKPHSTVTMPTENPLKSSDIDRSKPEVQLQMQQQIELQPRMLLVNPSNTPDQGHVHPPSTDVNSEPQSTLTVITVDPKSGASIYSSNHHSLTPASIVHPASFTPIGAVATNPTALIQSGGGDTGGSSQTAPPGVRTVCGACGGVMPPPGATFPVDAAGIVGATFPVDAARIVGATQTIYLNNGANHQTVLIASEDPAKTGGVICATVDKVNEDPTADAGIQASSTSTSLRSSSGTSANVDICRICHCEGEEPDAPLIAPCYCTGSLRWVHQSCLQQWIKSSETRKCELCKFEFIMETKIKPLKKWEKLEMTTVERRKIMCSVTFHAIAITCVIWSLYVLIDRTTDEVKKGNLEWPFWTKLIVVAIGFIGGLVFMYVQFKMYFALCRRWRAFNRVIYVQDIPDALLTSSKEKLKVSALLSSSKVGRGRGTSGSTSVSKENSPELATAALRHNQQQQQQPPPQQQPELQLSPHEPLDNPV